QAGGFTQHGKDLSMSEVLATQNVATPHAPSLHRRDVTRRHIIHIGDAEPTGRNGNAKTGRVTEVGSQIATCRGGAPVSRTDENSRIGCYDRKARRGVLLGHDVSHRFGVGVAVLSRYVSGPRLAQLSKLTLHTQRCDAVGHNDALDPRSP